MKVYFTKLILLILIASSFVLVGCSPIEDILTPKSLEEMPINNMTPVEYTNKINRDIFPIINEAEGLISSSIPLSNGTVDPSIIIPQVNKAITNTETTIEGLKTIYPSNNYKKHKDDTIIALKDYLIILKDYRMLLDSFSNKDNEKIEKLNSIKEQLKSSLIIIKSCHSVYTN